MNKCFFVFRGQEHKLRVNNVRFGVFTAVALKNPSSGMWCHVALRHTASHPIRLYSLRENNNVTALTKWKDVLLHPPINLQFLEIKCFWHKNTESQMVIHIEYETATLQRRMASSGMVRRVALVRTDVSEEPSASIIGMTRIGELGTLVVTSRRCISS
jgi:hypothetical protein